MKNYKVIGMMSGTSLDGLDIAYCELTLQNGQWHFVIPEAQTFEYSAEYKDRLQHAFYGSASDLVKIDADLGTWMGQSVQRFITDHNLQPDFIASHGHTIFHAPQQNYTTQIGNGSHIAAHTGLPVIYDFRSLDVAHGGQGAPLVPIGDKLLFSDFDFCLNLGGIANISFTDAENKRRAFDICPCNMPLNYLANMMNKSMDYNGEMSRKGNVDTALLDEMNALDFYSQKGGKSLGKEWFDEYFFPLLKKYHKIGSTDLLATSVAHIVQQIAKAIEPYNKQRMLVTGGGARNTFLVELLRQAVSVEVVIPHERIIDYKEALVFAFLGVLKMRGEINTLSTVTGACKDSSGGIIIYP